MCCPTHSLRTCMEPSLTLRSFCALHSFEGISSRNRATESWPWVEKYRPSSLNDLIAHQEIISTLNRLIDAQKLPHLLFYGPPGTGKTSMIIAAARRLYGKNYGSMVLEVHLLAVLLCQGMGKRAVFLAVANVYACADVYGAYIAQCFGRSWYRRCAQPNQRVCRHEEAFQLRCEADHPGRSRLDDQRCAVLASSRCESHVFICARYLLLLVADISTMVLDALTAVIEKYTKNARFCLICNYVSKIIPALQSRCTRFRFAPLNESQVSERVKHIAELEKYVRTNWTRHPAVVVVD